MRVTTGLLALLLTACATPDPVLIRPDPPPANLTQTCSPGPEWPEGDTTLGRLLAIVAGRETAAAICRAQLRALAEWAAGVSQ